MKRRILYFCLVVGIFIFPTWLNKYHELNHQAENQLPGITNTKNFNLN
ncbi:hypothetical protein [Psychrobacillus sp. L4]